MKQRWVIAAVLVAALFIMVGVVFGAADYFLKIDDVKGESADAKHKGEIDILSWTWGVSQPGTGSRSAGGAVSAARVQFQDFRFTMRVNSASPIFFQACATGRLFKQAVFTGRKAGKAQQEFYRIIFTDIVFTSYQTEGTGTGDQIPIDRFSFNFGKVAIEYSPQKTDGSLGAAIQAKWDVRGNTKF